MGDVLSFLLGAGIISVFATQIITWWRERQARHRERDGLLRILFAEVSNNEAYLEFIGSFRRGDKPIFLVGKGADKHLDVEAWKETRVKLAQHLSSEKFATLAGYYSDLLWLRQQLGEEGPSAKQLPFKIDMTPGMARELHKKADKVKAIILAYIPDATEDIVRAADVVGERQIDT